MITIQELLKRIKEASYGRRIIEAYFYHDGTLYVSFENEDDNPDDVQICKQNELPFDALLKMLE